MNKAQKAAKTKPLKYADITVGLVGKWIAKKEQIKCLVKVVGLLNMAVGSNPHRPAGANPAQGLKELEGMKNERKKLLVFLFC